MGQTLKEKAQNKLKSGNPSQLGDPVSLKAETSNRIPTESEKGAQVKEHKSLKQVAQESNPSMLGDPVSLKAETSNSEPTENDRGALGKRKRESKI